MFSTRIKRYLRPLLLPLWLRLRKVKEYFRLRLGKLKQYFKVHVTVYIVKKLFNSKCIKVLRRYDALNIMYSKFIVWEFSLQHGSAYKKPNSIDDVLKIIRNKFNFRI